MQCFKCGSDLPEESIFCQVCGADLRQKRICAACGTELAEAAVFCPRCGHRRETAPQQPIKRSSIRRLPTVLLIAVLLAAIIALLWMFRTPKAEEEPPALSPADAAKSVLYLEQYDSTGDMIGSGSGFLVGDGKTVVTNFHVIEDVYAISAFDAQGDYAADVLQVLHANERMDLAVLELDRDTGLSPLPLGDSDPLIQGDSIYAIGYPLGMNNTVSDGIISAMYTEDNIEILQITAPVSPGSSGGALLDPSGTVIGIVFAGYEDGQNMNLAIAVKELKTLLTYYSRPAGLDALYLESHPQINYDRYEVGVKYLKAPSLASVEAIRSLWDVYDHSVTDFEILIDEALAFYDCEYCKETLYIAPDILSDDFNDWFFDVDRSFGDTLLVEEDDGHYLYFFYEVRETAEPVEDAAEEAAEKPAEEPVEEAIEEAPACTHIWSIWAVGRTPSCTSEGQATACCTLCRAWERRVLPALGHSYENGVCMVCGAEAPVYVPPVQTETPAEEQEQPSEQEAPPVTDILTKEMLQGDWRTGELDGIYGRCQTYTFSGQSFYWKFWKGGMNSGGEDAIEAKDSGTFTIDGNTIYFSNGAVGTYAGGCLHINGLVFYRR
ncbi:MAG: trypsin-like peptidase domain-containing protein [Oscillospiraceae bacterium]|nr:trypsin-like peptidase domain-containing protein [Oscillospiraceae bacterium]